MTWIIGVRFKSPGKVYYFDPETDQIACGDHVIVETKRGVEYGTVVLAPRQVEENNVVQPLKPIIRLATPEDDEICAQNRQGEREAYAICLDKIQKHELPMKLIDAEYTFDRNKLLFYFTADGRVDFRNLVKDLASVFRTRIELRQIGVRDETKILGGIAICGRPFCCSTYLTDFVPVSIRMAKEQNLSLNPAKISGACGRLMCCLKNEEDAYEYLNQTLPNVGSKVKTLDGLNGQVQSVNVLKQRVKVLVFTDDDEKEIREFPVNELEFEKNGKVQYATASVLPDEQLDEIALRELAALEREDEEELAAEEKRPKQRAQGKKKQGYSQKNNHNKKSQQQKNYPKKRPEAEGSDYREYKVSNKDYKKNVNAENNRSHGSSGSANGNKNSHGKTYNANSGHRNYRHNGSNKKGGHSAEHGEQ